jgi:hypothetical protein
MKTKSLFALVLAAFSIAASAQTVTVTGTAPITAIGDQIGSQYDQFNFNNGSFAWGVGAVTVTSYDFVVGGNCTTCTAVSGSAGFTLSSSVSDPLVVPVSFTWLGGASDTITFQSTSQEYVVDGQSYLFTTDAFSVTSGGGTATGSLTGTITAVPEPGTYALMLVGCGALMLIRRRNLDA